MATGARSSTTGSTSKTSKSRAPRGSQGETDRAPQERKRTTPANKRASAGERLREDLAKPTDTVALGLLVEQAVRVANRLEKLAALNSGDETAWLRFALRGIVEDVDDNEGKATRVIVEAKLDNTIAEERQQTMLLQRLLADIHRQRAAIPMGPGNGGEDEDDLDDLG